MNCQQKLLSNVGNGNKKKVWTNLENWDFNKTIEQSCEPKLSQKLESKLGTKVANKNCDQKNASEFPA